jgi:ADP-heptose:LPS heptosyltransferase
MEILSQQWKKRFPPQRILAIRLQALGDVVITLPYLQNLKDNLPANAKIDFLTRKEVVAIPKAVDLFNKVYSIGGGRNWKKQFFLILLLLPKLFLNRYDVVIDLQNNINSRLVRKFLMPAAWSEFDRFSSNAAGERNRMTIEAIGLGKNEIVTRLIPHDQSGIDELLKKNGWDAKSEVVVLNPAGAFESRRWPIGNYADFSKLWLNKFPQTQFLILGTKMIEDSANFLKNELKNSLINLVDKTKVEEAFAIIQKAKFVLSEDSGLMHMAWVSGIPTFALFGSTRSDWARPLGNHTAFFDSSDLECGNCMLEICKYADSHCLTRYSPEMVFERAITLLQSISV